MDQSTKPSILVVDDEMSIRESFSLILEENYNVLLAASGESALKKTVDEKVDLVYLDIRMPGMDGMETLKKMMGIDKDLTVIMVTAVNDVQKAGEAIKLGAKDYLVKPFNVEDIKNMTERILKKKDLTKEAKEIRSFGESLKGNEIVGQSKAIDHINELVETLSKDDSSVIIFGEAGVEKEVIAASIHRASKRGSKPFKIFNTSNIGENLLRTKIFGSGLGNSSEILKKEKGILEEANEGTVFFNNIEKIPVSIQEELAAALKKKEILRVGSDSPISIDVRIISSTYQDLKTLVSKNEFSKELFNLIGEAGIEVPPLRDRKSDIPLLLNHYLDLFMSSYNNRNIKGFSDDTLEILSNYPFPGNTEELKSIVRRIVLTSKNGQVTIQDIPFEAMINSPSFSQTEESKIIGLEPAYSELEKDFIGVILKKTNNNKEKAAKVLGLGQNAFQAKLESLGIKI